MLDRDPVSFKQVLVDGGIELDETAGHGAGGDVNRDRRFAGLAEIGISARDGGSEKSCDGEAGGQKKYLGLGSQARRHVVPQKVVSFGCLIRQSLMCPVNRDGGLFIIHAPKEMHHGV
jgi:hypothetical protein